MWGVILGAATVLGLSRFARYRAWRYGYGGCHRGYRGHGYGWGRYDSDRRGGRGGYGFRDPQRVILRRLFEELDTTPGQEKVISEAFDVVVAALREFKGDLSKTRHGLAEVFRREQLDPETIREELSRQENRVNQVTASASEALAKVHAVLDPKQREQLADILEKEFGRGSRSSWRDV